MNGLQSIVVGVDFSAGSGAALRQALRIATWHRARVRAVHVIDTIFSVEGEPGTPGLRREICEGLVNEVRSGWESVRLSVPGARDLALSVRVQGLTAGVLSEARDAKADLLVLGARGAGEVRTGLGTLATSCVRHAACPVLLVKEDQTDAFRTIVVGVDFSPTSLRALEQGVRLAAQDGAALHVVHVTSAPWRALGARGEDVGRAMMHAERRRLEDFARPLGHEGAFARPKFEVVEHAGHRSGLAEYVARVHADLLIVGTRGRSNLRDLLLGSTAERALRESPCSVLAVKPTGFTHALATGEGVNEAEMVVRLNYDAMAPV